MGKKSRRARLTPMRLLRVSTRIVRRRGKKPGAAPGTIVHTGEKRLEQPRITLIRYGPEAFESREIEPDEIAGCFPPPDSGHVTWLNVDGLHDTELLRGLGQRAGLHPLIVEDIGSVGQRPKQEEYDGSHYIVLRMLRYDDTNYQVEEEQLSVVVGPDYVLSFQESVGDSFDPVRERLRQARGQIRSRGADYLAYALMDAVVDEYFTVIEKIGDRLEDLEQDVILDPRQETVRDIHHLKNELLVMRRAVWPLRDLFNTLIRDDSPLFSDVTRVYLRDAYDHAVQVIDNTETMRDLTAGLLDMYLSSVSNRMNETMKVLTIIATIFIPLTFLAGVYGMNFEYMPELHWPWAYPVVWIIMVAVAVAMFVWFRRKSWL
ncbi:MAG: magnesium/cobalt transporter CorA [Gemmatimonadota bacterium]|jgi:magnesium transporter